MGKRTQMAKIPRSLRHGPVPTHHKRMRTQLSRNEEPRVCTPAYFKMLLCFPFLNTVLFSTPHYFGLLFSFMHITQVFRLLQYM